MLRRATARTLPCSVGAAELRRTDAVIFSEGSSPGRCRLARKTQPPAAAADAGYACCSARRLQKYFLIEIEDRMARLRQIHRGRCAMALAINDTAPDFEARTTEGPIRFHDWIGNSWVVLFSHPKDFTPVCTTELGYMAKLKPEFDRRNTKIIGLSVHPVTDHKSWVKDIEETQGAKVNYPMIGDPDLNVAKAYDMIHPNASAGKRTAVDNATVRTVFIVGPDKKVKAMLIYPMSAGRNFDEVLRLLDSLQLNAKHTVATPVNWKPGEDVIIPTSVSDEDAKKKYPQGFKTHKPYLRTVSQPK